MQPKAFFQLKSMLEGFRRRHPKALQFVSAASSAIDAGSVIELTLTTSDGRSLCTNLRVTPEDLADLQAMRETLGK